MLYRLQTGRQAVYSRGFTPQEAGRKVDMGKDGVRKICVALGFVLGITMLPVNRMGIQAAEVIATVHGTVLKETTTDVLFLSTREGTMQIKLDNNTDASECKILLPDKKISVSVSGGTDGYLHAVKITSEAPTSAVTVDTSSTATVTGTINKKTTGDVLYFDTAQGQMQIKLDSNTSMKNCSVLVAGRTYQIVCARGSDAMMHAVSISDGGGAVPTTSTGLTPAPADLSYQKLATVAVVGKVTKNTRENMLYLSTDSGEMQIVIDSNSDTRNGMVLTPGSILTVSIYRGSDAYMHAACVIGIKGTAGAVNIDTSSPATVSGTVSSKSTEDVLYLDTPQGEMQLKLDAVRSISNCKVFVAGKRLTVVCARGADACMHALNITG